LLTDLGHNNTPETFDTAINWIESTINKGERVLRKGQALEFPNY
jgi:hypothetical protein